MTPIKIIEMLTDKPIGKGFDIFTCGKDKNIKHVLKF